MCPSSSSADASRASAERLDTELLLGDAEALPFLDGAFDAAVSVFGSMFAPDHPLVAAELVRVTRPGGTIALASWSPEGFIGAMFRTIAAHVPPPAGVASPMLWGTEEHLAEIFGSAVTWSHRRRTFTFRFVSAEAMVEYFATNYGPTLKAIEAAGAAGGTLTSELRDLVLSWNRLDGRGPIAVPSAYLESVGKRN